MTDEPRGALSQPQYRPCLCTRKNHGDVAWRCPNEAEDGRRTCRACLVDKCPMGERRAKGPNQRVSRQVTTDMVEAAIRAWNVAEPDFQIEGTSYHRTFGEVITAALEVAP